MENTNTSPWGALASRFENKQPRKILSLDGGGIRGVITLEILSKLEKDLKSRLNKGDDFRLSDYFDYFGGTSTGAIIAAGLAIGMSVDELLAFYTKKGKAMFDHRWEKWKSFYESGPLLTMLQSTFGADTDMDIANGKFKALLTLVTMNRTTDSPWPISNNPLAKYNNKERPDNNQKIKLYQLIRASTAAPAYFPPETLQWDPNDDSKTFVFVDGGVTPYNNPAFLLYRMTTLPAYNLNWEKGEDKLLIVSIGTGSATTAGVYGNIGKTLKQLPENLLYTMQVDQDINCRTVGRCTFGAPIDRELGDMIPKEKETDRDFLYVRYNVDLSKNGLKALGLEHLDSDTVRKMDKPKNIKDLQLIGAKTAISQVNLEHFGAFV
jgi:patatin-like phospholipase/acyl hydrolase